jgi:coenzyme PQQ precursor peptide PqqA
VFRLQILKERRKTMWTKPTATDLRFGFEVTMYIAAK